MNWDAVYSASEVVAHYDEIVAWVASARPARGSLLDLGCGTGSHAVSLARHGFDVVGVDFALGMLARAAARAARDGAKLDLRLLDVRTRLPFADGSFEAVLCSYLLQALDDPVELLRDTRRLLKADGLLLVEVPVRRSNWVDAVKAPTNRLFLLAKLLGSRVPGATQIYDAERLQDELRGVGFSIVQTRSFRRSFGVLARRG